MAKALFTSSGTTVELGRLLGKGGEGAVYDVNARPDQVAKLYHPSAAPDAKKQAKLSFMAATADKQLLQYAAWPQETLHPTRGGPVIGFLMPKISGRHPIHEIYSPAHRKQENPKATWENLLYVARNTAAAFDTLHSHGHVLGDVNQGNAMVGADTKVVLIDSDSFQVNANGVVHYCEVGVGHFTPPELQSLPTFKGYTRTQNHDNFGLALLIFHLLFGGRHPFSGVPMRAGVGESLEADIKALRYAYARDHQSRFILPPPRSIALSIVGDSIESMFHYAFTERGANQGGRPTARNWVTALDALRSRLQKCGTSPAHVYPNHLRQCPWCALERQGVVYFIHLVSGFHATPSSFVLVQVWAAIQAVPPPPEPNIPRPEQLSVAPTPLPPQAQQGNLVWLVRGAVVVVCLALFVALPALFFVWGLMLWGALSLASASNSPEREAERSRRQNELDQATQAYEALVDQVQQEVGPRAFHAKRAQLTKARDEYQALPRAEKAELDQLQVTARERQLQKYLDGCYIDAAVIKGVGNGRKATLRSFGIETALDVTPGRISQVRGFGPGLTTQMLQWRTQCESKFRFNPAKAVTDSDRNAVYAKYASRRIVLEAALTRGPSELQRFTENAKARADTLERVTRAAAQRVAQAKADRALL